MPPRSSSQLAQFENVAAAKALAMALAMAMAVA